MSLYRKRCGMIGQEQDLVLRRECRQFLENSAQDVMVDSLNRLNLRCKFALVSGFIRSLNMKIDKISTGTKGRQSRFSLACKIGIDISGSPWNLNYPQTGAGTQSFCQINGGDYRPPQPVFFIKPLQLWFGPLSP